VTLQKREKLLAAVTLLLVLWLAARFLLGGSWPSVSSARADRDRVLAEVQKKQGRVQASLPAAAQLADWQQRALPSDVKLAGTLYQNWLFRLAEQVKLDKIRVDPGESRPVRNIYHLFSFTVRGQGSFDNLVRFLFEFYSAGHLHQVRQLTIKPLEDPKRVDLMMIIEALSLPGADRTDKLSAVPGAGLAHKTLDDYQKHIVGRQLFAPYRPPSPPPPPTTRPAEPPKPPFDEAKYVFLTGIVQAGDRLQAWIKNRPKDEEFRLVEGDTLATGTLHAKIVRIGSREIEIEVDGRRSVVRLGANFRESLPAVPESKPEEKPADKPAAEAAEKPAEPSADKHAADPADKPAEPSPEKRVAEPAKESTPRAEEKPAEPPVSKPVEPSTEKPTGP